MDKAITIGEYIAVYADNVFALTTLCYSGHPAPWTAVTAEHSRTIRVHPIRPPGPHRDDASAIWPGAAPR
ncbi:hypothetical protein [Streptomyces sp. NPDC051636]|uniref:hypothetical protein n=1 Tax=Streptomyces sp. NPDC051636 TaxID=3365663 RepID=UPI0037B0012C